MEILAKLKEYVQDEAARASGWRSCAASPNAQSLFEGYRVACLTILKMIEALEGG